MANVNDAILDVLTGHSVGLQRLSNATVRKIIALLKRSDERILERLASEGGSEISRERLETLLANIRVIVEGLYEDATGQLKADLDKLAEYEAEYQADMFRRVVPVEVDWVTPSPFQIIAATNARPFQGKLMREWFTDLPADAFKRLRNAIRAGVVEGRTIDQIVRDIRGTRAQGFKDGILEINRRAAEVTVRTAVAHTANAARNEMYRANSRLLKGVQWVSTLDSRTSLYCMAHDGKVYPLDAGPRPPAHPNCLPGHSLVTPGGRIAGASKRWFKGEMVTVRTRDGRVVSATPNHPILTDVGWKAIGLIEEGDKLVCVIRPETVPAFNGENDHVETRIEDVTEAFFSSANVATVPVPTSAPDFHGDGAGSEVAVVGADCGLHVQDDAALGHHGMNTALNVGNMGLGGLLSLGALGKVINRSGHATDRIMGGGGKGLTFDGASPVHACLLLSGSSAQGNPAFGQDALDGGWADAEFIRDALDADAGSVCRDDVVHVERRHFSGHVYNLETEKHVYYSTGIVIHNCRSIVTPVLKSLAEMGIKGRDLPPGTRASMDGAVAGDLDYDAWLRKKPQSFQESVLGKEKAKLFRAGLKLDRFISRAGDELTLDELKQREAEAWQRAFSN